MSVVKPFIIGILIVMVILILVVFILEIFALDYLAESTSPIPTLISGGCKDKPYGIEIKDMQLKLDGRWGDVAILDKLGNEFFNTSDRGGRQGCFRYHVPATYNLPETPAPFWIVDLETGTQYHVYDLPWTVKWMYCGQYNCECR